MKKIKEFFLEFLDLISAFILLKIFHKEN